MSVVVSPDMHPFAARWRNALRFSALRGDDTAFADLVRSSFERMASEGTLNRLYARWLADRLPIGETLDVPISPQLAEMYRLLGQPD